MDDREHSIRQRAYEIWEMEGRPEGRHQDHWQQAARELGADADLPRPGGIPSGGDRVESAASRARDAVAETAPEGFGTGTETPVADSERIDSPSPGYGENLDGRPDDRRDQG